MEKLVKISRKTVLSLILVVASALCAFWLCGCGYDVLTRKDVIHNGYSNIVTLNYMGGTAMSENKHILFLPASEDGTSYIPDPSDENSQLDEPVRSGYTFRDFCEAKTDADGNLVLDANGDPAPDPDKVWDFKTKVKGEVTLCARWWEHYKMVIHYGDVDKDNNYEHATEPIGISRDAKTGEPNKISSNRFSVSGYTFLDYYSDAARQNVLDVTDGVKFDAGVFGDDLTVHVYGKTLTGTYMVVRKASDFVSATFNSVTNVFLDADVDMNDLYDNKISFDLPQTYTGTFVGNNHVISNIKLEKTTAKVTDTHFGLFNFIETGAKISDVTFKNATVKVSMTNPNIPHYYLGFFAGRISSGAKVTNVKIDGTFDYEIPTTYDPDNCTYDGFAGELPVVADPAHPKDEEIVIDSDCGITQATVASPKTVVTADKAYTVYVKYISAADGTTALGDVYALTELSGTTYRNVSGTVSKNADGTFTLTPKHGDVYVITVGMGAGDVISASVVKTARP